jgi:hypothetical protein
MQALDPDPVLVTKYETTLDTKMDGFEKLLGKQKYMAGDVSLVLPLDPCFHDILLEFQQLIERP